MSSMSKIEWTTTTWNPVTGCSKISIGCLNCYAERYAKRLQAMGQAAYKNGFNLTLHEHALERPLLTKSPRLIFVNSMSDLFHEKIPDEFIMKVFNVMNRAHWHRFQVLTKRSERLRDLKNQLPWAENIWMGVTVEHLKYLHRIDDLRNTAAAIKFISCEPLLSSLNRMDLQDIDWVIVGGESGPRSRPMNKEWVREIRDMCFENRIPFFFKQWGGFNKKKAGRLLDGRLHDEMPITKAKYKLPIVSSSVACSL